jgi:hypothetical protein
LLSTGRDEGELGHVGHREKARFSGQDETTRNGVGRSLAKMKIAVTIRRLAIHESADCHVIPAKLRVVGRGSGKVAPTWRAKNRRLIPDSIGSAF